MIQNWVQEFGVSKERVLREVFHGSGCKEGEGVITDGAISQAGSEAHMANYLRSLHADDGVRWVLLVEPHSPVPQVIDGAYFMPWVVWAPDVLGEEWPVSKARLIKPVGIGNPWMLDERSVRAARKRGEPLPDNVSLGIVLLRRRA